MLRETKRVKELHQVLLVKELHRESSISSQPRDQTQASRVVADSLWIVRTFKHISSINNWRWHLYHLDLGSAWDENLKKVIIMYVFLYSYVRTLLTFMGSFSSQGFSMVDLSYGLPLDLHLLPLWLIHVYLVVWSTKWWLLGYCHQPQKSWIWTAILFL